MSSIFRYIALCIALILVGCTSSLEDDGVGTSAEGLLSISVDMGETRAVTQSDLIESGILKVYNSAGQLVRRYTAISEDISDYFAVGEYSITYTAGESVSATFDSDVKWYEGESETFTISSQETTEVAIIAKMQNLTVSIAFDDETLLSHYTSYNVVAYAADSLAAVIEGQTPTLTYNSSADGYFIMPDGVSNIVWQFIGDGAVVAQGVLEGVESAHQYKLSFRYSDYLDVSLLTLNFEDTEDYDDSFDFKVQPVLKSVDFDIDDTQIYVDGDSYQFTVTSLSEISYASVTVDGTTYSTTTSDEGITYDQSTSTITLTGEIFSAVSRGGEHYITVEATDINGSVGQSHITVGVTGFWGITDEDFWANTATLQVYVTSDEVSDVKVRYRYKGEQTWSETYTATKSDTYIWSAQSTSEWSSGTNDAALAVSQLSRGIVPSKEYECQAIIDGVEGNITECTSGDTEQEIPYGSLSDSSLSCYTEDNADAEFWSSGNNSYTSTLCSYSTAYKCAYLKAKNASYVIITVFAAGNLYTGTFDMGSTSGTANFGQPFDWEARPQSLKFNYMATVGSSDMSRVYIAIVDWTSRRGVTVTTSSSESNPPDGYWDPTTASSVTQGQIIGYGSVLFSATTSAMAECEIPIYYYDNVTKPSKSYAIVISASTSYKGDYATGSESSALWVSDFKFGY